MNACQSASLFQNFIYSYHSFWLISLILTFACVVKLQYGLTNYFFFKSKNIYLEDNFYYFVEKWVERFYL